MIVYEHGKWGVQFIFRRKGSVFGKAACWAVPAAVVSASLNFVKVHVVESETESNASSTMMTAFASFIAILGFMVVFRSNQAWERYWKGSMLLQNVRGEWFNACSSLFAFCSREEALQDDVARFQQRIARLMSFMYASALQSVSGATFEMLNQDGIDKDSIEFLSNCSKEAHSRDIKCEVILQWVQRLVADNTMNGVLPIAPPILSRVFQELSLGMVDIQAAKNINKLLFPFPYAQLLSALLIVYTLGVPCAAGYVMDSWWGAAGTSFTNVFVLWGVNYLAAEIEHPFGLKPNDLHLAEEMEMFNDLVRVLLHKQSGVTPYYAPAHKDSTGAVSHGDDSAAAFLVDSTGTTWDAIRTSTSRVGGGRDPTSSSVPRDAWTEKGSRLPSSTPQRFLGAPRTGSGSGSLRFGATLGGGGGQSPCHKIEPAWGSDRTGDRGEDETDGHRQSPQADPTEHRDSGDTPVMDAVDSQRWQALPQTLPQALPEASPQASPLPSPKESPHSLLRPPQGLLCIRPHSGRTEGDAGGSWQASPQSSPRVSPPQTSLQSSPLRLDMRSPGGRSDVVVGGPCGGGGGPGGGDRERGVEKGLPGLVGPQLPVNRSKKAWSTSPSKSPSRLEGQVQVTVL